MSYMEKQKSIIPLMPKRVILMHEKLEKDLNNQKRSREYEMSKLWLKLNN